MKGLSINPDQDIRQIRKEFNSLETRANQKVDSWNVIFLCVHPVWTLAVVTYVAATSHDIWLAFFAVICSIYIPGIVVSTLLSGILDWAFGKRIERYVYEQRTTRRWYERYLYLRDYLAAFDEEERLRVEEERRDQAEAKRVRLLPVRDAIQQIRSQLTIGSESLNTLEATYRRKQKWYPEYRSDEEAIAAALERLGSLKDQTNIVQAKFGDVAEEVSGELLGLSISISTLGKRCESLLEKMKLMRDWTPPSRTSRTTIQSGPTRENRDANLQGTHTPINSDTIEPRPGVVQASPRIIVPLAEVVVPPPPPKRRVLNRELKKIPFEDYVGRAAAQMATGDLGEIVALHYEIRRVEAEMGFPATGVVRRVSAETDTLGYDIESFSQGEKVFVEVKSTTGSFWSDFFLSSNEREVMERLGERYWLYRIFELSKIDASAKLSIFRGKTEIEASFELEPVSFRLKGKQLAESYQQFESLG